jgi:primosomal protein N'
MMRIRQELERLRAHPVLIRVAGKYVFKEKAPPGDVENLVWALIDTKSLPIHSWVSTLGDLCRWFRAMINYAVRWMCDLRKICIKVFFRRKREAKQEQQRKAYEAQLREEEERRKQEEEEWEKQQYIWEKMPKSWDFKSIDEWAKAMNQFFKEVKDEGFSSDDIAPFVSPVARSFISATSSA